jgi:peroxin-1
MPSKRNSVSVIGKDRIGNNAAVSSVRENELAVVELDTSLGRMLGLTEGQKVGILGCTVCGILTVLGGYFSPPKPP